MSLGLLVPDLLMEVFFHLPSSIDQKIIVAQVSQFWRNIALDNQLFWSSFAAGSSKADCDRVPLMLERSGSSTMLHIQFNFSDGTWPADAALSALLPHTTRIESLDVKFGEAVDIDVLLNSNLEFPALKILRLNGWERWNPFEGDVDKPTLWLTAPRLRSLDLQSIYPSNWNTLLAPGLESIRMHGAGTVETLAVVFKQCRLVSRVAFHDHDHIPWSDKKFQGFTARPLAPALCDLELDLSKEELVRLLNIGFSDVVLHALTAVIPRDSVEMLTALLFGVGPLAVFERPDYQRIELHDNVGRIRRLQCWDGASSFSLKEVWDYLSLHHGLHETVREIRIPSRDWGLHLDVFESFPPKLPEGITIGIYISYFQGGPKKGLRMPDAILRLPGLAKIQICGPAGDLSVETLLEVVAKVEPPEGRTVGVCAGKKRLTNAEQNPFVALQMALGDRWGICTHCTAKF